MDDIYNGDLKQRYINEKEETTVLPNGYLNRCFRKSAEFEFALNKDISNFTFYEILDMYKTWNLSSCESLQVVNSQLSLYTQWCLQQNLVKDAQNHFLEVKKEQFQECINIMLNKKKIVTRQQVISWANELRNPSDSFIFLAIFEGIGGKNYCELVNLKISDFHDGKVKLCTGREIKVSDTLYNMALESNETTDYYGVENGRELKLNPEDLIIKNYPNVQESVDAAQVGVRITRRIKRNAKFLGVDNYLSGNSLKESGKISFIQQRSKDLEISCYDFISNHSDEIEEQFDCRLLPSKNLYYDKYKEYLD